MLESYFFIPAIHPKLADKLTGISADHIVIDLEDSVKVEDKAKCLNILKEITFSDKIFVRPPLFINESLDHKLFKELISIGFRNFVVPKFRNETQLMQIENQLASLKLKDSNFVLVIENPESLFNLKDILKSTKMNLSAIGFGSLDYCAETGMHHTRENLKQPRFLISGISKSMGLKAIDVACMEVNDEQIILHEIRDAFEMGFEGKFLIHPKQLSVLQTFSFFSESEIIAAKEILSIYEDEGKPAVFNYKGKAIEPPHIRNYQKILNWAINNGKQ